MSDKFNKKNKANRYFGCLDKVWWQEFIGKNPLKNCTLVLKSKDGSKKITFHLWAIPIVLLTFYLALSFVYSYTYVWQVTIFTPLIHPQDRAFCELNAYRNEAHEPWLVPASFNSKTMRPAKPKIAILELHDNAWKINPILMKKLKQNRQVYANKWNYDVINGLDYIDIDKSIPAAWSKLKAAQELLSTSHSYDYIFYIDLDAIIMNMNVNLDTYIDRAVGADIILTEDSHGINTGLMLLQKSKWTSDFLSLAFAQKQLAVNEYNEEGIPYPFEYEQRAFHYLYGTSFWLNRGLPVYRHSKSIQEHVAVMPQCAFNSYSLSPYKTLAPWVFDSKEDWSAAQYAENDFAIHFAGVKGQAKTDLMDYYLDRSIDLNEEAYKNKIIEKERDR